MIKKFLIFTFFLLIISQITVPAHSQAITDVKNQLGTAYVENAINKARNLVKAKNYIDATILINSINQWTADSAEYHTDLFKTLKKIENADVQANIEKELAIKFAVMRDEILFLNAEIFIHENKKRNAVENLVEIVKSQPNSELGFKAYKLLKEIGFTYGVDVQPVKTYVIQP